MKKLSQFWTTKTGLNARFTSLSAAATGIVLLGIVGCGGGGGGSKARTNPTAGPTNLPSVDPPPTPAPTPAGTGPTDPTACDANTYKPNYVPGLLAGLNDPNGKPGGQQLLHWKAFAIRIYFTPDPVENTPARKKLVVDGFNQWVTGTNNRSRWVETTDITNADAVVTFKTLSGTFSIVGLTYSNNLPGSTELISYYQDVNAPAGQRSGDMVLGFTGDGLYDQSTAAHEFGHLLGLGGHSPLATDLMFWLGNTTLGDNQPGLLTTSDINSLRTAYCDNFFQGGARYAKRPPITGRIIRHGYR